MDTITHALSGALLGRATEPAKAPGTLSRSTRMWVGFWSAAFPDSDVVLRAVDPFLYVTAHRGVTHSLLLLPLWALLLAWVFRILYRGRYSWRAFYGICALGIGAHIAGDVITAFGTMILAPFSDWRVQLPATFIIDPYFTGVIVLGLVAAKVWAKYRLPAVVAVAVLVGYVGFQMLLHDRAMKIGSSFIAANQIESASTRALPQPFSPFHWMIVIEEPSQYRIAYVSLTRGETLKPADDASWLYRVYASYRPVGDARWIEIPRYGHSTIDVLSAQEAWNSPAFEHYKHFAMFPAVHRVDRHTGRACVTFQDLRFALVDRELPFRYVVCRSNDGTFNAHLLE